MLKQNYSFIEASRSLGVGESALRRWADRVQKERQGITPQSKALTPEQQKIQELEAHHKRLIERVCGAPSRKTIGKKNEATTRLSGFQSVVAFQFARVLEHATTIFGSLQLAEEWLENPGRHLAGYVRLDMGGNPLGFKVIADYLQRVALVVYH